MSSGEVKAAGPAGGRRGQFGFFGGLGPGKLLRVNERVFCSTQYGVGNILYVVSDRGVVVIDTTESEAAASRSFEEFRGQCSLPVTHIIYSHFHGDHIRGARVLRAPKTEVVAQRKMPDELAALDRIRAYRQRADAQQFGYLLRPRAQGREATNGSTAGYVRPTFLFDEEWRFTEGDLSFELYHTEGETVDHVMVWIPELGTLFPGDLFYHSFPMLSSPMKPDRPVMAWADSLDRMLALRPKHLVPSHGLPISGQDEVDAVLGNYCRAIRHVHDETVARINLGESLDEIRSQVVLPDDLRSLPYLQERYGKVAWAVVGIFRHYAGWYDMRPGDLNPTRRAQLYGAILDASGGPGPVISRARAALNQAEDQLALELSDIVLAVRPANPAARTIREEALRRLAATTENSVARNIYRTAAKRPALVSAPVLDGPVDGQRLLYAGVWMRGPGASRSRAPVAEPHDRASAAVTHDGGGGEQQPAGLINDWYDRRMYQGWEEELYEGSDFHNLGYWSPGTKSIVEACENLMEVLLAFIPRKTGDILDVACGKGATTRHLLKYYSPERVTGINISEKQLRTARLNASGASFALMDATQLAFGDASFDNLLCVEAAFHFVPKASFVAEAFRVLRPGGRLLLSDRLSDSSRPPIPTPWSANLVTSPPEYRDLYLQSGFERVEIVDASENCTTGLMRHRLNLLRNQLRQGAIGLPAFQQQRNHIFKRMESERRHAYYLLVCAQKPLAAANITR